MEANASKTDSQIHSEKLEDYWMPFLQNGNPAGCRRRNFVDPITLITGCFVVGRESCWMWLRSRRLIWNRSMITALVLTKQRVLK